MTSGTGTRKSGWSKGPPIQPGTHPEVIFKQDTQTSVKVPRPPG